MRVVVNTTMIEWTQDHSTIIPVHIYSFVLPALSSFYELLTLFKSKLAASSSVNLNDCPSGLDFVLGLPYDKIRKNIAIILANMPRQSVEFSKEPLVDF